MRATDGMSFAEAGDIAIGSRIPRSHVGTVLALGWWLALGGTALAASVLLGYVFQLPFLWRPLPFDAATHPLTACLVLLTGLALMARGHRTGDNRLRVILFAIVVVSLLRLADIAAGTSFISSLDGNILARAAAIDSDLPIIFGWRSATTIGLLGISLLLRCYQRDLLSQLVGVLALAQPLIAIAGYALHQSDFFGQMAPFTALPLVALAFANLFMQAHRGFLKSLMVPSRVSRILLFGLVLQAVVPYLAALLLVNISELARIELLPFYVVILSLTMMVSPILLAIRLREVDAERRKLDHMLMRHVDALKREMVERERLRQMAEAASEAKSTFLASMSHELRTPLNAVLGYSELVLAIGATPAEKVAEYVNDIHVAGKHLLSLVDDVLDLTRIESGSVEVSPQQVHIRSAVSQVLRIQRLEARKKRVTLGTRLDRQLTKLHADEVALRQILLNLVSNAIRASPEGGHVRISAVHTAPEWIEMRVQDNGQGMSPELIERIGEPFLRAGSAYDANAFGAGLGLAIVKRLMTAMRGEIAIASRIGVGTTITLRFPVMPARADPAPQIPPVAFGAILRPAR